MSWWDDITGWWSRNNQLNQATQSLRKTTNQEELDSVWVALPDDVKSSGGPKLEYAMQKKIFELKKDGFQDPFKLFIEGALDDWLKLVEEYGKGDEKTAKANLAKLTAHVLEAAGATAALDMTAGTLTLSGGPASSTNTKQLMTWLGFGAVLTAVAHDPVKIGLLRPYQDSLEQTFRNRRPDSADLFTAYQQRSLSAVKIEDVEKISDTLMAQIETENEKYYDTEISKWGYSEFFSNALKDSATKTLSFGNLMALAKQGRLNRGMAIFSLWGYGLDRKLMKIALDALDQANETANYEGFRAQIEPAYVEGAIDEASLKDYWKKLHIPQDVQDLMMPRFKRKREVYALKAASSAQGRERDLTVSQLTAAYTAGLTDRTKTQNDIMTLGYDLAETKIILDLADTRKKLPGSAQLKRLPLTDYEKAWKNGLITQADVLDRMKGEYAPEDIELERKLMAAGKA